MLECGMSNSSQVQYGLQTRTGPKRNIVQSPKRSSSVSMRDSPKITFLQQRTGFMTFCSSEKTEKSSSPENPKRTSKIPVRYSNSLCGRTGERRTKKCGLALSIETPRR